MAAAPATASPATAGPWTRGRVAGFGAIQAGVLAVILAGWYTAAGQHSSSEVWPWLAVCLTGLGLSAAANGVAFFGGHRAIMRRPLPTIGVSQSTRAVAHDGLVSGAGMTMFHRPNCLLVAGKNVIAADRAGELEPCGMCRP